MIYKVDALGSNPRPTRYVNADGLYMATIIARPCSAWQSMAEWPVSPRADYQAMAAIIREQWDYYPGSRMLILDQDGHLVWACKL